MPKMMILPANDINAIKLVEVPDDFEEHEAFRHVVGILANLQPSDGSDVGEEIEAALEDHQFRPIEFILGPRLD